MRIPVLGMPLLDEGARLATRAAHLLAGHGLGWAGATPDGPLLPLLTVPGILLGAEPTHALRVLCALLGALIAPLVYALGLRFGLSARRALLAGVLTLVHPLLVAHAGGPAVSAAGAVTTCVLGAVLLLTSPGRKAQRWGVGLALLLPLVDPVAVVYVPAFLVTFLRREVSARARALALGFALVSLLLTPLPAFGPWAWGGRLGALLVFALLGPLVVLLPFLRTGLATLWRAGATPWIVGAALQTAALLALPLAAGFGASWEGLAAGAPLVVLLLLAGVAGLPQARAKRAVIPALGLALAGAVFALSGPVQVFFLPDAPPAAARAHRLSQALEAAEEAAGKDGWIGLDLWPGRTLTALRLADGVGDRNVGRTRERPRRGEPTAEERADPEPSLPLLVLPELPADRAVGVITRFAPEILEVSTEGGSGIFVRTPTARFGPWLVLHVARP